MPRPQTGQPRRTLRLLGHIGPLQHLRHLAADPPVTIRRHSVSTSLTSISMTRAGLVEPFRLAHARKARARASNTGCGATIPWVPRTASPCACPGPFAALALPGWRRRPVRTRTAPPTHGPGCQARRDSAGDGGVRRRPTCHELRYDRQPQRLDQGDHFLERRRRRPRRRSLSRRAHHLDLGVGISAATIGSAGVTRPRW